MLTKKIVRTGAAEMRGLGLWALAELRAGRTLGHCGAGPRREEEQPRRTPSPSPSRRHSLSSFPPVKDAVVEPEDDSRRGRDAADHRDDHALHVPAAGFPLRC
jgi:hypothetical protein